MEKRCSGCMRIKGSDIRCEFCGYVETDQNAYHQLPAGTVLCGQYQLGRVLGQGGFGITYLGWDTKLEIPVAIKEFYPNHLVSRTQGTTVTIMSKNQEQSYEEGKAKFLREAKTLARLRKYYNIVQVHTSFTENNTAYIVMEYIEGITLKDHIQRSGGKLSVEETFGILRPIFNVMQQVHYAGMIHRDISPDNIMIQPNGIVKILDFGTARDMDLEAEKLTHSTQAVLKRGFAPVEQYSRGRTINQRADVYALCATIYYCLTGEVPPDALDRFFDQTPIPWAGIPGLTSGQIDVLEKGTALRAEDRTPDLWTLEAALFSVSSEEPQEHKTKEESGPNPIYTEEPQEKKSEEKTEQKPIPKPEPEPIPEPKPLPKPVPWKPILLGMSLLVLAISGGIWGFRAYQNTKNAQEVLAIQETQAIQESQTGKDASEETKQQNEPQESQTIPFPAETVPRQTIYAGDNNTFALKEDGTVVAVGNNKYSQCDVSDWKDIVNISADYNYNGGYTVGLKKDGSVITSGNIEHIFGYWKVYDWESVIAVSANAFYIVGLKADRTIITLGSNNNSFVSNISAWKDIIAVSANDYHAVGLKSNGTVVSVADARVARYNTSGWKDIIAVSAGGSHAVGLKSDGTVVAVGKNNNGECNVSGWKDIIAVSAGSSHTVGLKSDGTVVAVGKNNNGECNVSGWKDIIAVSAGGSHTVGLKSDGTVVAVGNNEDGQCDVSEWTNIQIPD